MTHQKHLHKLASMRPLARFSGISLRDLTATVGPVLLLTALAIGAAYWFMRPAPPKTITIASGPTGSNFRLTAEKYRKILARNGVKLQIVPSEGSLDNLRMLGNPATHVDVGFVQGGVTEGMNVEKLVSLGSVFHVPLVVFYRTA